MRGEARVPVRARPRQFPARRPGGPDSAPLGVPGPNAFPGGGGGGRLFPASHWGPLARAQLPAPPSGPRARGCLDGSPCRSALSPPCTRRLRTSPPTCSLLLTSRAAGTMGWGCHSNQTGRHNPGMCAAPPRCAAVPPALPPPPSAGCGLGLRGAVGGAARALREQSEGGLEEGGRNGGVEVWGGGGAGGRHLLAEAASPAARTSPAAHGLRLAPRPAGGGAPTSPPPRAGHAGPTGHRGGAAAAVRGRDGERGRDVR